jgi:hypothetical protein
VPSAARIIPVEHERDGPETMAHPHLPEYQIGMTPSLPIRGDWIHGPTPLRQSQSASGNLALDAGRVPSFCS